MKRLTFLAVLTAGLFFQGTRCPIDNSLAYFTGQTQVVSGKLLKLYRCAQGHTFWLVN